MKNFIPSSLILLIALIFAGCSEHGVNPTTKLLDTSVISPLVTGDEWIYDVSLLDSAGIHVDDFQDTVKVGLSTEIKGEMWYLVSHNNPNIKKNDTRATSFFSNRQDGYYFLQENSRKPFRLFKYPVQAGFTEQTQSDVINIVTSTNEIIQLDSSAFTCNHYQVIFFTLQNSDTIRKQIGDDSYLCPGIGLVREISHFDGTTNPRTGAFIVNGSEVITLKSYTLK